MKDFYKECDINATVLWSNNKRRSKGLPMFRQCGYHKRRKARLRLDDINRLFSNVSAFLKGKIKFDDIFKGR